tara:strand:- start:65 stop:430 length:366 start_codon:yes stop_codon:yes gene_type:complete
MSQFIGLYKADGSPSGELRYLLGKLTHRTSCSLCDLTHGWNPFGKSSWKAASKDLGIRISLLHRDEASDEQLAAVDTLPAIIQVQENPVGGNGWVLVMTSEEIESYRNAPRGLLAALKGKE